MSFVDYVMFTHNDPHSTVMLVRCKLKCDSPGGSTGLQRSLMPTVALLRKILFVIIAINPLMHKVAKMKTWNNGVRRHTGLIHGFWPTVLSVAPLAHCVVCLSVVCDVLYCGEMVRLS